MVHQWAFMISDEATVRIYTPQRYKRPCSFRVSIKCTHTRDLWQTQQIQLIELTTLVYHHADSSISYTMAARHSKFFQMYASVNSNTMISIPQPYRDVCGSCSRQTATFRRVNMLTYGTFLQFLSTLHHPDCRIPTDASTLWKSWKVDEETWTMLVQSTFRPHQDTMM